MHTIQTAMAFKVSKTSALTNTFALHFIIEQLSQSTYSHMHDTQTHYRIRTSLCMRTLRYNTNINVFCIIAHMHVDHLQLIDKTLLKLTNQQLVQREPG